MATLSEAPDNVSMAAVALAIGGGGALSSFETTVLMSVDETWTPYARRRMSSTGRLPWRLSPKAHSPTLACVRRRSGMSSGQTVAWPRTPDATGPSRVASMPAEPNAPGGSWSRWSFSWMLR